MEIKYQNEVSIPAVGVRLKGELFIPKNAKAIILFSHGSGSSRFSKRNQYVTSYLPGHGFGMLLFDLLAPEDNQNYYNRFAITCLKNGWKQPLFGWKTCLRKTNPTGNLPTEGLMWKPLILPTRRKRNLSEKHAQKTSGSLKRISYSIILTPAWSWAPSDGAGSPPV